MVARMERHHEPADLPGTEALRRDSPVMAR